MAKYCNFSCAALLFILLISNTCHADTIEIIGTQDITIPLENSPLDLVFTNNYFKKDKTFKINVFNLNPTQEDKVFDNVVRVMEKRETVGVDPVVSYISASDFDVDLTMNNVPVLDQMRNGTCGTFIVTAAMDAIKNSGDFISQQCFLDLGNSIEEYQPSDKEMENITDKVKFEACKKSGWDGQGIDCIIERALQYGVVAKEHCPRTYPVKDTKLSIEEYKSLSLNNQWSNDFSSRFLKDANDIDELKKSLDNGNRVLVAVMLNIVNKIGHGGFPVNDKQTGLWALPVDEDEAKEYLQQTVAGQGAHGVIVTGYNDKQQVLKIRNSWGTRSGDNGEYYMTYEYYKALNLQAIEIYEKK